MASTHDIVVTGIGVASPIGIGAAAYWASLCEGRSGVRNLGLYEDNSLPLSIGGEVADFEAKKYVRPRKSLKVMSRDIQLAFAAADLACEQAGLHDKPTEPDRLGIVFGAELISCELSELVAAYRGCIQNGSFNFDNWGRSAMAEMYPLWMLKYLPNMPACHIGIAQDARGPNNSLTLGDVSSLSAVAEAMRVIQRGAADVMIAGGTGSRIHAGLWARSPLFHVSRHRGDPTEACRPFDAQRDGSVNGEGSGAIILERRDHAEARGAEICATVLGYSSNFEPRRNGNSLHGSAVRQAITSAMKNAGVTAADIGHVNANAGGLVEDDKVEAQAIRELLGDVPVTAPKSYFGNLGAGTGAVELMASLLALKHGTIPPTLNYKTPDPECPINVVHGRPEKLDRPAALILNHTPFGQAIAVVVGKA